MDAYLPISADELKDEFDKLKNVVVETNSEAKFNAAALMMLFVSSQAQKKINWTIPI